MSSFQLTESLKEVLQEGVKQLKGYGRRIFMAKTVQELGYGGQSLVERELGWHRKTIRKGQWELAHGREVEPLFSLRGRKSFEEHLPKLLEDIERIVSAQSQADPTFRTTQLYSPLTAPMVHQRLIDQGYTEDELPTVRTLSTKLNDLGFRPQKVAKSKPIKKIEETDAIFEQIHHVNQEADQTEGTLRISIDAKAKISVGAFSRGGKSRQGEKAVDHDFDTENKLGLFGFFLPDYDESYFYFSQTNMTADFVVDCLQSLWPELDQKFKIHTLLINSDNGPDTNSHRTQFIKRMIEFAYQNNVVVKLAYYPPYHSKYNPIERLWGILENHWRGELLDSIDKILALARTMTWKGKHPQVQLVHGNYPLEVSVPNKLMAFYEGMILRLKGLEKWFVHIPLSEFG